MSEKCIHTKINEAIATCNMIKQADGEFCDCLLQDLFLNGWLCTLNELEKYIPTFKEDLVKILYEMIWSIGLILSVKSEKIIQFVEITGINIILSILGTYLSVH